MFHVNKGAPLRLARPLSDQFPVRVCVLVSPLSINRLCICMQAYLRSRDDDSSVVWTERLAEQLDERYVLIARAGRRVHQEKVKLRKGQHGYICINI